jgi:hypothetical protein
MLDAISGYSTLRKKEGKSSPLLACRGLIVVAVGYTEAFREIVKKHKFIYCGFIILKEGGSNLYCPGNRTIYRLWGQWHWLIIVPERVVREQGIIGLREILFLKLLRLFQKKMLITCRNNSCKT